MSGFFHDSVTLGLFYGIFDEFHHAVIAEFRRVGGVGTSALTSLLTFKCRLKITSEVLVYGVFRISLHTRVDGGVYSQSIGI
ncbi:hypothetical protein IMSAG025_00985 [Muribaculaceae bacterium]|nr:hypothetical protein IMSAG025_00985 [Muribaculaceae bacterium]